MTSTSRIHSVVGGAAEDMTAIVMHPGAPALGSCGGVGVDVPGAEVDRAEPVGDSAAGGGPDRLDGAAPWHESSTPARSARPRNGPVGPLVAVTTAGTP
jgi:hypothetical protein